MAVTDDGKRIYQSIGDSFEDFNLNRWLDALEAFGIPVYSWDQFGFEVSDANRTEGRINLKIAIRQALAKLTSKERVAIKRAVILGQTQTEIARSMRLSQQRISQLLASGTHKLQSLLA